MNGAIERFAAFIALLRSMPREQLALRAVLMVLGIVGAVLLDQPWGSPAGVLAVMALLGVLLTTFLPDTGAPAFAIGALVLAWLLAHGLNGSAPVGNTLGLAAVLYLLHTGAALCAAMPPTARLDGQLLTRWTGHVALTLVGSAVVIGIGYGVGRLPGSLTLELVGLVGAVLVISVPVWLARGRR